MTLSDAFDKYFASGLSSYTAGTDYTNSYAYELCRPDVGLSYDAGVFVLYDAGARDFYPVVTCTGTGDTAVEIWATVRAWHANFVDPAVAISVGLRAYGASGDPARSVLLHPTRGWYTIKLRAVVSSGTPTFQVQVGKLTNTTDVHLLIDSWGYTAL